MSWSNDLNSFAGARSAAGSELKYGGMVNVLYDFVDLTPYVTAIYRRGRRVPGATDQQFALGFAGWGCRADRPEFQRRLCLPGPRRCGFSGFARTGVYD